MVAIVTLQHRRHSGPALGIFRTFASAAALVGVSILRAPARIHRNRQLTQMLGQMSEHQLRDIGLSWQDVVDSAVQPVFAEVGAFLAGRVADRRGRRGARP